MQSADLLKLKAIRTKKLNKKRARLFEDMGLPIEVDKTSSKKTIFLTKGSKRTSVVTNDTVKKSGKLISFEYHYIYVIYSIDCIYGLNVLGKGFYFQGKIGIHQYYDKNLNFKVTYIYILFYVRIQDIVSVKVLVKNTFLKSKNE